MKMFGQAGEFKPDSLIAGNEFPILAEGIGLKAGYGRLKRGSLILRGEDRAGYIAAGTITMLAEGADKKVFGILADDTDTGTDASAGNIPATAYRTGQFNRSAVIVAGEDASADAYEEAMNDRGLYLCGVQNHE